MSCGSREESRLVSARLMVFVPGCLHPMHASDKGVKRYARTVCALPRLLLLRAKRKTDGSSMYICYLYVSDKSMDRLGWRLGLFLRSNTGLAAGTKKGRLKPRGSMMMTMTTIPVMFSVFLFCFLYLLRIRLCNWWFFIYDLACICTRVRVFG